MSHAPNTPCPDWPSLIAQRDQERSEDAWGRALEHLDSCEACRERAFAAEPVLVFQDLPSLEVGRGEIDDMKQAVAALRRAQSFEKRAAERPTYRYVLRAAALAGIGLLMLFLQGTFDQTTNGPQVDSVQAAARSDEPRLAELWPAQPPQPVADARPLPESRPLVEELEPLGGTMIQLVDSDIDMVVFYSDNLDV